MSTLVKFRRGTTEQNNTFTGALGEITIDTTIKSIRVHDGVTQGGTLLVTTSSSLLLVNNQTTSTYNILSSDVGKKIRMNTDTTSTVIVPLNLTQEISVGSLIKVRQVNIGNISFMPENEVILNVRAGSTLTMALVGGEVTLHKVDINEWDITGDLSS